MRGPFRGADRAVITRLSSSRPAGTDPRKRWTGSRRGRPPRRLPRAPGRRVPRAPGRRVPRARATACAAGARPAAAGHLAQAARRRLSRLSGRSAPKVVGSRNSTTRTAARSSRRPGRRSPSGPRPSSLSPLSAVVALPAAPRRNGSGAVGAARGGRMVESGRIRWRYLQRYRWKYRQRNTLAQHLCRGRRPRPSAAAARGRPGRGCRSCAA